MTISFLQEPHNPATQYLKQSAFLGVARTEHSFHDIGRDCLFHAAFRASHCFTLEHMHALHSVLSCPWASACACAFEGNTIGTVCRVSSYTLRVTVCAEHSDLTTFFFIFQAQLISFPTLPQSTIDMIFKREAK